MGGKKETPKVNDSFRSLVLLVLRVLHSDEHDLSAEGYIIPGDGSTGNFIDSIYY